VNVKCEELGIYSGRSDSSVPFRCKCRGEMLLLVVSGSRNGQQPRNNTFVASSVQWAGSLFPTIGTAACGIENLAMRFF